MIQGEGDWHKKLHTSIDSVHKANILSIHFHPTNSLIATGSTDKTVSIFDFKTREIEHSFTHHTGAVIALDFNPIEHDLLLAGSMDKSHSLLDIEKKEVIQHFKIHSKFVNRVKWSPSGKLFVTGSHDGTINFFNYDTVSRMATNVKSVVFANIVEAIEFTPDGGIVIISVREDNYLNYVSVSSFEVSRYNMNVNGDDHVSFTAMDLACSPSGTHLLVATDKNRIILYRLGTSIQVRNFYGSVNDRFSNPRLCWHPSSKYFYVTSQDGLIYVWDTVTQKIVDKITGHRGLPRDLDLHADRGLLASCSFDKTIKFWQV